MSIIRSTQQTINGFDAFSSIYFRAGQLTDFDGPMCTGFIRKFLKAKSSVYKKHWLPVNNSDENYVHTFKTCF